jgi:hypothetical protein
MARTRSALIGGLDGRGRGAVAVALALAWTVAGAACIRGGPEPSLPPLTSAEMRPSFVAAGTDFTVALLDPVGTRTSSAGDGVRARVEENLVAPDATVVVPRGSVLQGVVARAEVDPVPLLALDFTEIATSLGPAPFSAKLHRAERLVIDATGEVYEPDSSRYDVFFTAAYPPGPAGWAAPGASVYYHDYYDETAGAIELPKGARLHVALSKPLGTSVLRF